MSEKQIELNLRGEGVENPDPNTEIYYTDNPKLNDVLNNLKRTETNGEGFVDSNSPEYKEAEEKAKKQTEEEWRRAEKLTRNGTLD